MSSSIGAECTELKQKYDTCFNKWYSEKFLKGDTTPECEDLFKDYKACVMVSFRRRLGATSDILCKRDKQATKTIG
jgi:TRIAP1/MDM35 family protein